MVDAPESSTTGSTKTWTRRTIERQKCMPTERLLGKHLRFSGTAKETLAEIHRNVKNVRDDLRHHSFWDQTWGKRVFRGKVASQEAIQQFVYESPLYDNLNKRWRYIPYKAESAQDLHAPFIDIITAAMEHFGGFKNRSVRLTHDAVEFDSTSSVEDEEVFKLVPDITIMGTGQNFSPNSTTRAGELTLTYLGCVSAIEVGAANQVSKDFEHYLVQMAHYAKQCFTEQDNRKFVYTLLLNEQHTHICLFDRSGAHSSSPIDIHLKPRHLVRLILGVCSADDSAVGFDTDIIWNSDKIKRFLGALDETNNAVCYELADTRPVFSCRSFRGVGTRFWSVKDSSGKMLLVKDAWHTKDNFPEEGFLEAAEEFVAVGPMVASQDGDTVSELRDFAPNAIPSHQQNVFWDRIFSRTTFEDGSTPLGALNTPQDLLEGLRNVIEGNHSLWENGFSYRRVKAHNLMLKPEDNAVGEPGIIDINLSYWLNRSTTLLGAHFRPGSPVCHSIIQILNRDPARGSLPHDHLDDTESIFYALCWITIGHSGPTQKVDPFPSFLNDWDDLNPKVAAYSKQAVFLLDEFLPARKVTPFFGPIFEQLLRKMHGFLKLHVARKIIAADLDIVQPLPPSAIDDYATILGFVYEAIERLRVSDEEAASNALFEMFNGRTNYGNPFTPSPSRGKRARKRDGCDEDDSPRGRKRPKKRAIISSTRVS